MGKFLLVEDDAPVARTVARVLSLYGAVVLVSTCKAALAALATGPVMIGAVIDIGLPDGSGVTVLEHLRERYAHAEALLLTGHLSRELIGRAFDLRADYLVKPVDRQRIAHFAERAAMSASATAKRLQLWARRHALSRAETEVLRLYLAGVPRGELAARRGVKENTIKRQITHVLAKCGHASLDALALELLRRDLRRR